MTDDEVGLDLDDLPKGWARSTLGELVTPRNIRTIPQNSPDRPYLAMDGVESGTGEVIQLQSSSKFTSAAPVVRQGDTLYGRLRPYLNKVAACDFEGFCSGEFIVLPTSPAFAHRFLMYRLLAEDFVSFAISQNAGDRPRVKWEQIAEFPVRLPPQKEQQRIVEVLDAQLPRLAAATSSVTRAMAAIRTWQTSYLLRRTVNNPAADRWRRARIGDLAKVSTGATPARGRPDYYQGGTVPWVTSALINGPVIEQAQQFVTEKALAETSIRVFPAGTLLLAMYGEGQTRGRCSELRIAAATNQACAAIQLTAENARLRPWVKLVLEATYDRNRQLAAGGVQPNLNLGLVREIQIPLPGAGEREAILDEVESARLLVGRLQTELRTLRIKSVGVRRSLLSAAFSGRLTPQDPDDEPASVLLDRIRETYANRVPLARSRRSTVTATGTAARASAPRSTTAIPAGVQEELPL